MELFLETKIVKQWKNRGKNRDCDAYHRLTKLCGGKNREQ